MQPVSFNNVNKILTGSGLGPEGNKIENLPIWTDNKVCVSCWKLTWKERVRLLWRGRVWVAVLSGDSQPPLALTIEDLNAEQSRRSQR